MADCSEVSSYLRGSYRMSSQERGCCFLHAMFQYSLPINIMDVEPTKKITAYQQAVLLRSPRAQSVYADAAAEPPCSEYPRIASRIGQPAQGRPEHHRAFGQATYWRATTSYENKNKNNIFSALASIKISCPGRGYISIRINAFYPLGM